MEYKANTPKANWLINYTILILSDQVREDKIFEGKWENNTSQIARNSWLRKSSSSRVKASSACLCIFTKLNYATIWKPNIYSIIFGSTCLVVFCKRVQSFFSKCEDLSLQLNKRNRLQCNCFPVNFAKFF